MTNEADNSVLAMAIRFITGQPIVPQRTIPLPFIPFEDALYEFTLSTEFKRMEVQVDAAILKKWGVHAKHWLIARFADPVEEKIERSYRVCYAYIFRIANESGIDPYFLHAVAMGEGLNDYILLRQGFDLVRKKETIRGDLKADRLVATDFDHLVIDSYFVAGLDNLGADKDSLKSAIRAPFFERIVPYTIQECLQKNCKNEQGIAVRPARISGLEAAIYATAAYLKASRREAVEFLSSKGVDCANLGQGILDFMTYAFFNNPAAARKSIDQEGLKRYTRPYDEAISESALIAKEENNQTNVRFNCLIRVAAAERMRLLEIYEMSSKMRAAVMSAK